MRSPAICEDPNRSRLDPIQLHHVIAPDESESRKVKALPHLQKCLEHLTSSTTVVLQQERKIVVQGKVLDNRLQDCFASWHANLLEFLCALHYAGVIIGAIGQGFGGEVLNHFHIT